MNDYGLRPAPPGWALEAGLPAPSEGEGFCEYVQRLGMDSQSLLQELTEQTICIANYRLASRLMDSMPVAFDRHVAALARAHVDPARSRQAENAARSLFGENWRRPSGAGGKVTTS